ncbi:beta-galactosidase [Streptomyces albidus (ex Kaewkla and Franco 2022)]|uniref:beta-galactosidase n=1 Tax=Streptomyces albidus (ex Kaewkla and Franco 2022) TaxID=722709 RepID=UPI0015EF9D17|nr:beta-galactosidase [Streptomyces albidus (ex Kaewkla and Franco 2022)]
MTTPDTAGHRTAQTEQPTTGAGLEPSPSVRLERRRLLVNGVPRILMAGEVHYFRLHRADWADRLDKLVAAGCTAVASYMPWLIHETASGEIDLNGDTSEYRDLGGFLELAAERGLLVIARPGPFIMAELKNEGIPFRVYRDHPRARPLGWDGERGPTETLDYLEPGYLADAERWYASVMPLLAEHLVTRGGPVAAVQLDNEVGMLSWITNTPEMTDRTLGELATWAVERFGREGAIERYGADPAETGTWAAWWRAGATQGGSEAQQLALHHDLGAHHRDRYAAYLLRLREVAQEHGVDGVPFLVNLHGTSEGRGRTYPIAISQLSKSYAGIPQTTSGSDHYIGELTVENVADLYVMNAFMAAVHDADQPLTSLEFEAGTGDYGEDLSRLVSPESTDLKTRLCVAQGNRLINYYLFAGGHNPLLDEPVGDGNDRIAFTGERHGFAAPVDPEGRLSSTYDALAGAVRSVAGVEHLLAGMDEEYDDVVLGFVPDHYLTEYCHPAAAGRRALVGEVERFRGMGPRDILARALLLGGFTFNAVDLSGASTSAGSDLDPAGPVVALASPPVLSRPVQERLAAFVGAGGRLLLHGVVPLLDEDGTPCTVLADALGLAVTGTVEGGVDRFPSVRATDWIEQQAEVRTGFLQRLRSTDEANQVVPLVVDVTEDVPASLDVTLPGGGRAVVLACDYPCHLPFWQGVLGRLGVERRIVTEGASPGLLATTTKDEAGQRVVHLLNVAPHAQAFTVRIDGEPFADGFRFELAARSGLMLPLAVNVQGGVLRWATAELDSASDGSTVVIRRGAGPGRALLETGRDVTADHDAVVSPAEGGGVLVSWRGGAGDEPLRIRLT